MPTLKWSACPLSMVEEESESTECIVLSPRSWSIALALSMTGVVDVVSAVARARSARAAREAKIIDADVLNATRIQYLKKLRKDVAMRWQ